MTLKVSMHEPYIHLEHMGSKTQDECKPIFNKICKQLRQQDVDCKVCGVRLERVFNSMFYFCILQLLEGDFVNGSKLIWMSLFKAYSERNFAYMCLAFTPSELNNASGSVALHLALGSSHHQLSEGVMPCCQDISNTQCCSLLTQFYKKMICSSVQTSKDFYLIKARNLSPYCQSQWFLLFIGPPSEVTNPL
jgi:hypothetical protein